MSSVDLLQQLIRLDTTNPPGAEQPAAELVRARMLDAGMKADIYTSPEGRANVVARIDGPTDRPALVLLSHLDVVGVEADAWSKDPFGGDISDGWLWGRGSLDMKGIAAMHIEAAATLAAGHATPSREVIVVCVADEEAGGGQGAGWLAKEHPETLGFATGRPAPEALGEGAFGLSEVLPQPLMPIVVGEKSVLWLDLEASGDPGHGALPPKNQAPLNLARAIAAVSGYGTARVHPVMREQFDALSARLPQPMAAAFKILASAAGPVAVRAAADVFRSRGAIGALLSDSIAATQIEAGYKHNVVPGEARASLDCRLLPDTDPDEFTASIRRRVRRHSTEVREVARHGGPVSAPGPLYEILKSVSGHLPGDPICAPSLTSGMTDLRFLRQLGAFAYGWVPLTLTPELLGTIHGHDERISIADLEIATEAMTTVVRRAAADEN